MQGGSLVITKPWESIESIPKKFGFVATIFEKSVFGRKVALFDGDTLEIVHFIGGGNKKPNPRQDGNIEKNKDFQLLN